MFVLYKKEKETMYETVYVYVSKTTAIYSHAHVKIAEVNKHNATVGLLCIVVIVV